MEDGRLAIARRAAQEVPDDAVVNLGTGIPTLVSRFLTGRKIYLHSENGVLGFGPPPPAGSENWDLIDAGKNPITELPGCVFFSSAESFAMIRGGHVDIALMGALQVDQEGNIANWRVPGQKQLGVGGAMDLALGVGRLIVTCQSTTADGRPKLVHQCSLPVTAYRAVDTVVTELGVFRFRSGRLVLTEVASGVTLTDIRDKVEAAFDVDLAVEP